jgi:hypothetical protein
MKNKIILDTMSDLNKFIIAISDIEEDVYLVDAKRRYRINAKSTIGCLLAKAEWSEIWVECEKDIYTQIEPWVAAE